jgi:hypothetical protein
MFITVGRFHFRPMDPVERQQLLQRIGEDVPKLARETPGFQSLHVVRPGDDEVLMVWRWEREADWQAAQPRFGPALQEYVVPNLAGPPERFGGEVVLDVTR